MRNPFKGIKSKQDDALKETKVIPEAKQAKKSKASKTVEKEVDEKTKVPETIEKEADEKAKVPETVEKEADERTKVPETVEKEADEKKRVTKTVKKEADKKKKISKKATNSVKGISDAKKAEESEDADVLDEIVDFIFGDDDNDGNDEQSEKKAEKRKFKPIEKAKLTIFLIENTLSVKENKNQINEIVNNVVKSNSGYIQVINYGSEVRKSEIFYSTEFNSDDLFYSEDMGTETCLFDALDILEWTLDECDVLELEEKRVLFESFEIIGIGNCVDNCSKLPEHIALYRFGKIGKKTYISTKYVSITESGFIQAATIGFRSIGSFPQNFA